MCRGFGQIVDPADGVGLVGEAFGERSAFACVVPPPHAGPVGDAAWSASLLDIGLDHDGCRRGDRWHLRRRGRVDAAGAQPLIDVGCAVDRLAGGEPYERLVLAAAARSASGAGRRGRCRGVRRVPRWSTSARPWLCLRIGERREAVRATCSTAHAAGSGSARPVPCRSPRGGSGRSPRALRDCKFVCMAQLGHSSSAGTGLRRNLWIRWPSAFGCGSRLAAAGGPESFPLGTDPLPFPLLEGAVPCCAPGGARYAGSRTSRCRGWCGTGGFRRLSTAARFPRVLSTDSGSRPYGSVDSCCASSSDSGRAEGSRGRGGHGSG